MSKKIPDFLKSRVGLFMQLSDKELKKIHEGSSLISYDVNEAVVRIGEDISFLGVILEGELSVSGVTNGGLRKELARFKSGDTFGEMALMSAERAMVDYIAEKPTQVLQIPVALFQSVLMIEPNALQHATRTIVERMKFLTEDPEKVDAVFKQNADPDGSQPKRAQVLDAQRYDTILIEVSAHHIHLSQEHVEALFGKGHQLTWHSDLSQPGQFASKEQLTVVGPKGRIEKVRVLGPVRKTTQVEISMTEQFKLGIPTPIRESGDLEGTPGCTLESPEGSLDIDKGLICALRHIHMSPDDAQKYGLKNQSIVRVRVAGDRELIFGDVLIRVNTNSKLAMHIDTDEANAANIKTGTKAWIDGVQSLD